MKKKVAQFSSGLAIYKETEKEGSFTILDGWSSFGFAVSFSVALEKAHHRLEKIQKVQERVFTWMSESSEISKEDFSKVKIARYVLWDVDRACEISLPRFKVDKTPLRLELRRGFLEVVKFTIYNKGEYSGELIGNDFDIRRLV